MSKKQSKILIIDDDERLLKAYDMKLSKEGFKIHTENDGAKAVDSVRKYNPDIILLDVLLPHKTGWDVLAELKADKELKIIPVIMVSNIGSDEREDEAIDAGAESFLVKSSTPLELLLQKVYSTLMVSQVLSRSTDSKK